MAFSGKVEDFSDAVVVQDFLDNATFVYVGAVIRHAILLVF